MILRVKTRNKKIYGYSSLWAKYVTGFDSTKHCIGCLKGKRCEIMTREIPPNEDIKIPLKEGEIYYICGVTYPYVLKNNFHFVLRGKEGGYAEREDYKGDKWEIEGAERVYFDDKAAREKYPNLGYKFLRCRNFQFGVHYFEKLKNETQKELF